VTYEVRTDALAAAGWPAPREAFYVEDGMISAVGRALFVTASPDQRSEVSFQLPRGWRAVTSWPSDSIPSAPRLTENLLVLTRSRPELIRAGAFTVSLVPIGPWRAVRHEVRAVLQQAIGHFVAFLAPRTEERYLAVLLPMLDHGAESFRQSLALTFPETPTEANRQGWANLLAHEVFHYWNGWALQPADYARSQWFQEGFTEYAANTAIGMDRAAFRACLARHVGNARRLTTSLEETGGRKGPPLYSAGALVALTWDVDIRESSGGARDLRDFFSALWHRTGHGSRAWERSDLVAALAETAPGTWESFLETHVQGQTPLPHAETFGRLGLRLVDAPDGSVRVEEDPQASAAQRRLLDRILSE
jgi:hypothetical protein